MLQKKDNDNHKEHKEQEKTDQLLEIIFYTDPLCCWSWAMEPQLRRIQYEYDGQIVWKYRMGGLLSGWENFYDELNSVSKPIQMGPLWMHAQQISGMPMQSTIWKIDPPFSSYFSCIAVKSAFLQSQKSGIKYLRLLREAIMIHGKNISREKTLIEIGQFLSKETDNAFNFEKFLSDFKTDSGLEAFRTDVQEVQQKNIHRFPTFVIKSNDNKGIIITGFCSYANLIRAIRKVAPEIKKADSPIDENEYKKFWGELTKREMEEII